MSLNILHLIESIIIENERLGILPTIYIYSSKMLQLFQFGAIYYYKMLQEEAGWTIQCIGQGDFYLT